MGVTPPASGGDGPAARAAGRITIAVLGLGEAGGVIARDLVVAGVTVRGFDPRVAAPAGVRQAADDGDACRGAGLVLSVNSAADAVEALHLGRVGCTPGIVWADLNTAAPRRTIVNNPPDRGTRVRSRGRRGRRCASPR
jgi:hypothetical protein